MQINIENLNKIELESKIFRNSLMGLEGTNARMYYKSLNIFLPEVFKFKKRSRRPALDFFNAALNYLYGITYGKVSFAVKSMGLDTYTGVLHTTDYKESMVFDIIEPIRPLIDRLLINLCMENNLKEDHFTKINTKILITKEGKNILITAYENYMLKKIKINGKRLSIKNHIFWQCRILKQQIIDYDISNTL